MHAYKLGTVLGGTDDVYLTDDDLAVHTAVLGGSGSGKSKFLERLGRCFLEAGTGFAYIDPHGDTSEDLLAYVDWKRRVKHDDKTWRKVHYLEPSFEMVFGYDPFKFTPLHHIAKDRQEAAYEAWLHTKVDAVGEVLQRKQNQMGFEGMPRLQRMLRNVLYAVGRAVDASGRHLPLADALVLLDLAHPRHNEVFSLVAPFLDREILSDFEILHGFKRVEDLRKETESTINRLRSFLGPVVKAIFSDTVNTLDFAGIVERGEILLLNLRETDYFSADQGNAIGGLFVHEVLTTMARVPRDRRKAFKLIIDEVGEFLGADLLRALGTVRKYKLSLILAGQDMTTFQKGELDLGPKVLSQCGTVVSFQQTYHDDLDVLAPRIFRGNLDHEELLQVVDRPDGHEFLEMTDYARGFTWSDNWTEGGAVSDSNTVGLAASRQKALQDTWGRSETRTETNSAATGTGHTEQDSETSGTGETPLVRGGQVVDMTPTHQRGDGKSTALARTQQESHSVASGESESVGGGVTDTTGTGLSVGSQVGETRSAGRGGGTGGSVSETRRTQLVPRTREERHPTGKRRTAYADQFEKFKSDIYGLGVAECAVKLRSRKDGFLMKVAHVSDVWAEANKFGAIDKLKAVLYALRAYYSAPKFGPAAQRERIDAFVKPAVKPPGTVPSPPAAATPSPPVVPPASPGIVPPPVVPPVKAPAPEENGFGY